MPVPCSDLGLAGRPVAVHRRWRGWAGWRWAVAAGLPTAILVAHAVGCYGQWIEDDAALTFAYARSLAAGMGPVLQPGAVPVEGYSNPAWLAVLTLGCLLRLFDTGTWFGVPDLVVFPKVVAALCALGTFSAGYRLARAVCRRPVLVSVLAGAVTAAVPAFVIWSVSGLENALFAWEVAVLGTTLARAATAGRLLAPRVAVVCGGFVALAALTRPDGLIYAAAYPVAALGLGRCAAVRPVLVACGATAAPVGAYLTWRWVTFGDWLPNTARAKEQGWPGWADLDKPAALVSYAGWLTCLAGALVVGAVLRRPGATRTAVVMLLVPLGLAIVAYAVLATDWMAQFRFSTPIWPLASLAVALSLAELARDVSRVRLVGAVAIGSAVVGLSVAGWYRQAATFARSPTVSACYIARNTGYTFNTYADLLGLGDASLLAVDGGGTALTSRLRFVDLSGLADAEIARYWAADDMSGLRDHVFEQVRPTFIRVWHGWDGVSRSRLLTDPRLDRDYVLIWAPRQGGGNWVRRDAVPNPQALAGLRRQAADIVNLVDAPYDRLSTHWWCGPVLRPTPPGSRPALTLPT